MKSPNSFISHSPLDKLEIAAFSDEERKDIVDRVEQCAIESAEDNQPASLPSEEVFDLSIPLTKSQRARLLQQLADEERQEVEDNLPASRPPFPGLMASRLLRRRKRR